MNRSRLRLKALGLCAMVLGLMAFGAAGAQADPNANWRLAGSNVTAGLSPSVDITEIEGSGASLLTEIIKAKVTYTCTAAKLVGVKLEPEGKLTSGGKVKFTGCTTKLNGEPSAVCVPKSTGLANGEIESLAGKGLLILHESEGLTRIEPTGENFAVIKHSPPCGLPESVPVKGKLFIKDCKQDAEEKPISPCENGVKNEQIAHLIQQGPLTKLFVISDTPEHAAIIDGTAKAALIGSEHVGIKWSGLPE